MIIFYDKKTGDIVGTIDGIKHSDQQLKMWIGNNTERKIVEYGLDKKNNKLVAKDKQKALFEDFINKRKKIINYKIDLKKEELIDKKRIKIVINKKNKLETINYQKQKKVLK